MNLTPDQWIMLGAYAVLVVRNLWIEHKYGRAQKALLAVLNSGARNNVLRYEMKGDVVSVEVRNMSGRGGDW